MAIVGKSLPKIEGQDKATGQLKYVGDLRLPRMLKGVILRSPLAHARVLNVDVIRALKQPGVRAIITGKDAPQISFGNMIKDEQLLAHEKVRYQGEPVAALAAEDEESALTALELIEVDYEELPAVFDPQQALTPEAPQIHPQGNLAYHFQYERGNAAQGFQESDLIFEAHFETNMAHHCYLEPRACLACPGPGDRVTLWGTFQSIFLTRQRVAAALGLEEDRIRVVRSPVGGGFGGKDATQKGPLAILLALKTGRPVAMVNSREEEFRATRPRVPALIWQKVGVKKDGTLVAKETRAIADNGAYSGTSPSILQSMVMRNESLYRFSHLKGEGFLAYTNKPPTGSFRGFGNPQGSFAMESQLDEIAQALDIDPLELRLKNALQPGDITLHGYKITSCGLKECLEQVTQAAGWHRKRAGKEPGRGLGLACGIHVAGNRSIFDFDGSAAFVRLDRDGKATLITGESDLGQGAWTALAQMAAEELGLPLSDISLAEADTDSAPFCLGAYASRTTVIGGNAVKAAAADAKAKLLEVAARLLEANPGDLEAARGRIFVKGTPERGLTIKEVCRSAIFRPGGGPIMGQGTYDAPSTQPDRATLAGNLSPNYSFAAHIAEVEVDEHTGQVKVKAFYCADDIGRAINPMALEGQIQGCISQGLSTTLNEQMVWDKGHLINASFADYKIPSAPDMPSIRSLMVETNDPVGPFGAKSGSESPIVPVAAALANAIYDATGKRIRSLPITEENILKAMKGGHIG